MKQANDRVSRHKVKNRNNKKRKRGKIYKGQPSQDRNIQKMWYTIKILNPQIIGIKKRKEGRRVTLLLPVSQVLG